MSGNWITGKEIMEKHRVLAVEIGQACYDGTLIAYNSEMMPLFEETKTEKEYVYQSEIDNIDASKIFSKIEEGGELDPIEALAVIRAAGGDTKMLCGLNTAAKYCYLPKGKTGLLFPFKWDDYFRECRQ